MARALLRIGAYTTTAVIIVFLLQQAPHVFENLTDREDVGDPDEVHSQQNREFITSTPATGTTGLVKKACGQICPSGDVILPDNYDSLFYKADIRPFIRESICGSPFNYLPDYVNPCWISSRVSSNPEYTADDYTTPGSRDTATGCQLRCLPLVHLAGFSKAGTADLYKALKKHPYFVHTMKEPLFWSFGRFDRNYTLERYISNYDIKVDQIGTVTETVNGRIKYPKLLMDASSTKVYYMDGWREIPGHEYLDEPKFTSAMSIRALTPQAKIIIIMRNPADRTFSRYRMFCKLCPTSMFHEFVVGSISEMKDCLKHQTLRGCAYNYTFFTTRMPAGTEKHSMFIRASLYYVYVKDWLSAFPADQIYFVQSEEFFKSRNPVLKRIYQFLGLDPELISDEEWEQIASKNPSNVSASKGRLNETMMNKTREVLDEFFRPYNRLLADLLHDERFLWKGVSE